MMYFLKTDPRSVNTQNVNAENMENKKYGFYLLQAAIIEFAFTAKKKLLHSNRKNLQSSAARISCMKSKSLRYVIYSYEKTLSFVTGLYQRLRV